MQTAAKPWTSCCLEIWSKYCIWKKYYRRNILGMLSEVLKSDFCSSIDIGTLFFPPKVLLNDDLLYVTRSLSENLLHVLVDLTNVQKLPVSCDHNGIWLSHETLTLDFSAEDRHDRKHLLRDRNDITCRVWSLLGRTTQNCCSRSLMSQFCENSVEYTSSR